MRRAALTLLLLGARAFAAPEVPVTFVAKNPRIAYRVLVGDRACTVPCVLSLEPGQAHLLAAAVQGSVERDLEIPPRRARVVIDPSNRMVLTVAGVLALTLGSAFAVGGGLFIAESPRGGAPSGVLIGGGALIA